MRVFSRRSGGVAAKIFVVFMLLLLILGGAAIFTYQNAGLRAWIFAQKLETMPNADYSPLVAELFSEERYDEAAKLASFVGRHPDMPGQEKIAELRGLIDTAIRKKSSPLERGVAFLGGFLSGGGVSTEARIGGLIANILASNGAISENDLPKKTKDDADRLAAALEAAHLGNSGKWFPGAMRTLRRSHLISPEYERFLLKNARESIERGQATAELESAVASTQTMVTELGLSRALGVHKEVCNDEDLEQLAMWSRLSPDETYITATRGGMNLFSSLPDTAEGRKLLTEIVKKGERGIRSARFWLK